jgi:hypothetical protein
MTWARKAFVKRAYLNVLTWQASCQQHQHLGEGKILKYRRMSGGKE